MGHTAGDGRLTQDRSRHRPPTNVESTVVAVDVGGNGVPIVLVHGWPDSLYAAAPCCCGWSRPAPTLTLPARQ